MRFPLYRGLEFVLPALGLLTLFHANAVHAFCFEEAAAAYGISSKLLRPIAEHESGNNPAAIHYNKNGSYDFGVMQINSNWYPTLGYDRWMALGNPCYNVKVGAWILSQCIRRFGYTWEAVGCYNAGYTAKNTGKRAEYAWKIYNTLRSTEEGKSSTKVICIE